MSDFFQQLHRFFLVQVCGQRAWEDHVLTQEGVAG